ncbi:hypothetical protein TCAL_04905 [Tigriopus californicus]|uniref:CUB domain-containing protein n=1 Tax=Tigriopus californicus TaxID=6832 RepID=A0A553NET3_TIGCA|nr:hypothetical protein TCAL_04905 [Tigriopus californicus]
MDVIMCYCNTALDVTARSLQFSNFLDRSDPASNAPIKPLPTAEDDVICPPEVQLDTGVTPVTLIIPITDATGCYEFTTPGYGENTRYPNALNAAYECTYEIRLPSPNLSPTFTILKDEFELQRRSNDGLRCPFDSLILKNIVETGQSVDDVESFDNNVQYCDELTEDKCFTVEPGNNNNRFQIIFKANNINRKRGARGLLCF